MTEEDQAILQDITDLEEKIDNKKNKRNQIIENLEENLLNEEIKENEDLLDISFKRSMALQEYQKVEEEAEELLSEFPDSVLGHFYLIKALEAQKRNEEALNLIENNELPTKQLYKLEQKLNHYDNYDFSSYWKYLKF